MTKVRDLLTFTIDLTKPLPETLVAKAQQCYAAGVHIRPFNRLRTGKELRWWVDLFLETFQDHWGFVPVNAQEVRGRFGVKQLRWIVDSRLFLVAETQSTPIAYLWATPEYNQLFRQMKGRLGIRQLLMVLWKQRSISSGKLHFIGIKKEFRDKNIASYLNHAALMEMQRRGYRSAEVGWIDEENTAARTTIAITGASVTKVHRVFEKTLPEEIHG
jgi:ribosomal protein S18 acetylase RimI-like enzyme